MAAKIPIKATTIIISSKEKPTCLLRISILKTEKEI